MEKMTYQQAYNKIIDAYFKDEIKPLDAQFCFCGTLCGNSREWYNIQVGFMSSKTHFDFMHYSGAEYRRMEVALLQLFQSDVTSPSYEDSLFQGMSAALDVLKEIHRSRGENVDDVPVFTKRVLQS